MDPKVIYGVLIGLTVLLFLRMKWRKELRMEEMNKKNKEHQKKLSFSSEYKKQDRRFASTEKDVVEPGPPPKITTQFMYNGHAWDACEVLGVSQDCSIEDAKVALEESIKDVDKESEGFFAYAYETLKKNNSQA